MRYIGMPAGMWILFHKSFERNMISVLGASPEEAHDTSRKAKKKYKSIIEHVPEFENGDRFKTNLVNCAMLSAFLLNMKERPTVEQATDYYRESMTTGFMKWFCRQGGKNKFSQKDIESMKVTEKFRAADRNPYSWNMEYHEYEDGSGYEARFNTCGICTLMKELGLFDLVPAMCKLDYTMSELGEASTFVREYTLASGGPYCDCGYKKKHG